MLLPDRLLKHTDAVRLVWVSPVLRALQSCMEYLHGREGKPAWKGGLWRLPTTLAHLSCHKLTLTKLLVLDVPGPRVF